MSHPDLDALTSWIHGFLDAPEAAELERHVSGCQECGPTAAELREEARILSEGISRPERLSALKAGLLQAAAGRRSFRGLLWQIPVAAAVLLGLVGVLLSNGPRHSILEGRVALQDGREIAAPGDLAGSQPWELRALEKARLRLSDQSTVDLGPGTELALAPGGERGVQPDLASGAAEFSVAPNSRLLRVQSPAGSVAAADGRFSLRIVFDEEEGGIPVKKSIAGAIVTVLAGSMSVSSAGGSAEAQAGQSAVLARTQAPLFLSVPQDKQEELLRRLEQLAARVAKLEEDVAQLEQKNKQLKSQLATGQGGAAWGVGPGQAVGSVRILNTNGAGGGPGSPVIIELTEETEKKPERNPKEKK